MKILQEIIDNSTLAFKLKELVNLVKALSLSVRDLYVMHEQLKRTTGQLATIVSELLKAESARVASNKMIWLDQTDTKKNTVN